MITYLDYDFIEKAPQGEAVQNLTELAAVSVLIIPNYQKRLIVDLSAEYIYFSGATSGDVEPDTQIGGKGYWNEYIISVPLSGDSTFTGYTATTEVRLEGIEDDILYLSGQTSGGTTAHIYIRELQVDINDGSDSSGDGSEDKPFLTLNAAWNKRILDEPNIYLINIRGTGVFPTTISLDGTGSLEWDTETYIKTSLSGTGRWKYGCTNLTLKNVGTIYSSGFGMWGTLSLEASDGLVPCSIGFSSVECSIALTVVGTPAANTNLFAMDSAVLFLQTFTGDASKMILYGRGGSIVRFVQNATIKSMVLFNCGIEVYPNKTLTIQDITQLGAGSQLGLSNNSHLVTGFLFHYGGYIFGNIGSSITVTSQDVDSLPDSSYMYFDNTISGLAATRVKTAIDEIAAMNTTYQLSGDSLFTGYTAATEVRLEGIENDIVYISGVTDTKVGNVVFTGYTATTNIRFDDIDADIAFLGSVSGDTNYQLSGDSLFTGYTATTNIRLNDIENDIIYISGVTDTKTDNTVFTGYTATTDTRVTNIEDDIIYISGITDTKLDEIIFTGYTAVTNIILDNIEDDIIYISGVTDTKADKNATIILLSGSTILNESYNNKIIEVSGSTGLTGMTITTPTGLTVGWQVVVVNMSTVTITIASDGTILSKSSAVNLANQYGAASIYHRGNNVYTLFGDIS